MTPSKQPDREIDELDRIIIMLATRYSAASFNLMNTDDSDESEMERYHKMMNEFRAEAKQAIEAYITKREEALLDRVEREVIGEDEPVYNPAPWSNGKHVKEVANSIKRELRAEQRQALKGLSRGES